MKPKAFTLVELLVVVAIIAILAAIAVPNMLLAQARAKVSRVQADMRTFDMAIAAYMVDNTKKPPTHELWNVKYDPGYWWGYLTTNLTTPIAYISTLPTMIYNDTRIQQRWVASNPAMNTPGTQPCTYVRNTWYLAKRFPVGTRMVTTDTQARDAIYTDQMREMFNNSGYVLYSCGPDRYDSTAFAVPQIYDPTNGVDSFGDIYRCAAGQPEKPGGLEVEYQPGRA